MLPSFLDIDPDRAAAWIAERTRQSASKSTHQGTSENRQDMLQDVVGQEGVHATTASLKGTGEALRRSERAEASRRAGGTA